MSKHIQRVVLKWNSRGPNKKTGLFSCQPLGPGHIFGLLTLVIKFIAYNSLRAFHEFKLFNF